MQLGMTRGSSVLSAVTKPALIVSAPLSKISVLDGGGGPAARDLRAGAITGANDRCQAFVRRNVVVGVVEVVDSEVENRGGSFIAHFPITKSWRTVSGRRTDSPRGRVRDLDEGNRLARDTMKRFGIYVEYQLFLRGHSWTIGEIPRGTGPSSGRQNSIGLFTLSTSMHTSYLPDHI